MRAGTKRVIKAGENWRVDIERCLTNRARYIAWFSVNAQNFRLADSDDPEEAEFHCEFPAWMFLFALARMRGPIPSEAELERGYQTFKRRSNKRFAELQARKDKKKMACR